MKLTTKQLDALASEIRMQLLAKKKENEKEKYVSHYLEIIKASGLMDQIYDAFKFQATKEIVLDVSIISDIIGLPKPNWHVYGWIKRDRIEEDLKYIIKDTYNDNIPSFDTIKHRLVLESIALSQEETIDDFISKMVEKFE